MTSTLSSHVSPGPLITTHWSNRNLSFYASDSEQLYLKHRKKILADNAQWEYLNKAVDYRFNSQGYRTAEWDTVNWQESIVVLGCSNTLGEGLAEEDTITAQLSNALDRPVVNLGVSGTSIAFSSYNSAMLCKNLPTPYAVVQIWTALARMELYTADNIKIHTALQHGHADNVSNEFYRSWVSYPENINTHMMFNALSSKLLWETRTRYYETSFFLDTANLLQCDYITVLDYARDCAHPGVETAKLVAQQIAKNLK